MNNPSKQDKAKARLCYALGEDDGVDPRYLAKKNAGSKKINHKSRQLCKEAGRVVSLWLMNQVDRPLLCGLQVVSVMPEHDGQNLCITVGHGVAGIDTTETEIVAELKRMQSPLRFALAQAVNRKRVPGLSFRYAGFSGKDIPGGSYAN